MTPERWAQIEAILEDVLDCPPEERAACLSRACRGDTALQAEVGSYLTDGGAVDRFMETPALASLTAVPALFPADASADRSGSRIGAYRLLRPIGHGGMGVVYLAARDDDEYERQVAVKFVHAASANRRIAAQFRTERQILANLQHPYIATLLDGGATPDGIPYFVLEYVDGRPITKYCDERNCSITDRLALFRKVCSAVEHAHRNLIVHRDLKPGNILVTAGGDPKLLDFGIAKILQPAGAGPAPDSTGTLHLLMTPAYASPEQVKNEPVTTASDVYALGLLLYELLTGCRAYDVPAGAPQDIVQTICEVEPRKPSDAARAAGRSEIGRRLAGDLDTIVLKALRKEPARRYTSVEQFDADIERHLTGLPVVARNDTLRYRTAKFVARNRYAVAAAAVVLIAIAIGTTVAVWQARIARGERTRAERRFADVRSLANSFLFEFDDAIANLPGSIAARRLVVTRALEYLDRLALESEENPTLQHDLAVAYRKVGDVQGRPYHANVGDTAGAVKSYRRSLAILDSLPAGERTRAETELDVSTAAVRLGSVLVRLQQTAEAEQHLARALAIRTRLSAAEPGNRERRALLAESLLAAGDGRLYRFKSGEALDFYQKALALDREIAANGTASPDVLHSLQKAYQRVGFVYEQQAEPFAQGFIWNRPAAARGQRALREKALEHHRLAVGAARSLAATQPANPVYRREIADSAIQAARLESDLGDPDQGFRSFEEARTIFDELLESDPENLEWRFDRDYIYKLSAASAARLGRRDEAERRYQRALEGFEARWRSDPSNTEALIHIFETYRMRGDMRAEFGDVAGALTLYESALTFASDLRSREPANAALRQQWFAIAGRLASLLMRAGRRADAAAMTQRMIVVHKERIESRDASSSDYADYASLWLTCLPPELRDPAAALTWARKAIAKGATAPSFEVLAIALYMKGDTTGAVDAAGKWFAAVNRTGEMPDDATILAEISAAIANLK